MKKIILITLLVVLSLSGFSIIPDSKTEKPVVPDNKENKISAEELKRLTKRDYEIRLVDKSDQTIIIQEDHKNGRHHDNRRSGSVVYIGTASIILIIILIVILV
jgi:hypothetical protein